ncbi:MAG: tetratricopeptide repeat protein, partial [Acidobacteriota bacterium]
DAFSMGVWSALRAIEIDDNLAEAHAVLGAFRKELDYNWTEVHREMKRALELNASSSFCRLFYGVSGLMPLGRVEAAVSELDYALDLDPLSSYLRCWLVLMLDLGRQYERGIDEATRVIENEPGYWLGHFMIGHLYRDMQSYDLALSSLKKSIKLSGESPFLLGWLGQSLANNGESTEARAIAERLQSIASQAYVPPTSFAWIYLGLGDVDQAFEWMDKAVDARDANIIPIKSYPFLDPLRDDPRFTELLRKMNLAP